MAKEQLKPKKGVVIAEINGVKYFKLQSNYPGDYTKNCGLLGQEIDENFYFLRSNDIDKMSVENGILTLTRVDGDTLSADISMPYTFEFDQKTGKLIITDGNGDVQILEGFVVEGKDVRVATDATLDGDGTSQNPLRISEVEKTGTYSPANEFLDMAVYDYYELVCFMPDEETKVYYYVEYTGSTEGIDFIEYPEVPTEHVPWNSPKYIKVREDIELPDPTHLGKGYRIVTKETIDNFGLLYNFEGVKKIKEALEAKGSTWRVPTRRDWALMLNAAEYCEDDRNHDTKCVNEWTGKNAGARAKSLGMNSDKLPKEKQGLWKWTNRLENGLPVYGEDNLPNVGDNTFRVYPVGYADGSRGVEDKDFDLEAFSKRATYWSSTPVNCNDDNCSSNVFTRTFAYDTRMVLQESSKPSSRMSLRLVRDYVPGQMNVSEVEDILGYSVPCVFISNSETGYNKIWTSINIGFKDPQFSGVTSQEWSASTVIERGQEVVYYINEWDGLRWIKKQMHEGDSIVLLDGGKDESGNTIYNHEWRIYKYEGSTEPVLVDTAEALKEEFQEEIDELHEEIDNEVSARTQADEALQEQIDEISGLTESIVIVEVEPTSSDVLKSYELHINDEKKGVTIDIPKDKTIKEITLGHMGATVNEETGEITDGPAENDEALLIVYQNQDGKYSLVEIDLEHFIIEDEFKDGLEVTDNVVKVKIDESSEAFLTVGPDGVKLSGVQTAIDEAVATEKERAEAAEQALDVKIDAETARATEAEQALDTKINEEVARAEAAEQVLDEKITAETERAEAAEQALDSKIDSEIERATAAEEALDTKIEEETVRAIAAETALDAKIDAETERATEAEQALDEKIDAEIARATERENEIEAKLDTEIERANKIDTNIAADVIGVNGTFSGNSEEGFAIDFAYVEYQETDETPTVEPVVMARVPGHDEIIESGDTAPLYINVGGVIYKITPTSTYISDAKNVFEAVKALDNEAKDVDERVDVVEDEIDAISEKVDELSDKVDELSDKVDEISGNVETLSAVTADEIERATAAEEALAGQDVAEDGHVMDVNQLTLKRNNGEEIAIALNFNFGSDMPLVG